jgi:hypothetical protein
MWLIDAGYHVAQFLIFGLVLAALDDRHCHQSNTSFLK